MQGNHGGLAEVGCRALHACQPTLETSGKENLKQEAITLHDVSQLFLTLGEFLMNCSHATHPEQTKI